jgi:hypothetical protein
MPTEANITSKTLSVLGKVPNSWTRKLHGNAFQGAGVPDAFFTCEALCGKAVFIEFKRPGLRPTKIQQHNLDRLADAGALTRVVSDPEECFAWLDSLGVKLPLRS